MKKSVARLGIAAMLVLAGGASFFAYAEEKEGKNEDEKGALTEAQLPAEVLATVKKAAPGATFVEAELEDEHGTKVYEVDVKTAEGKELEVVVGTDGKLIKTEADDADDKEDGDDDKAKLTEADLPAAVLATIKNTVPGGTITEAELEEEDGAKSYEAEVKTADGKKVDVAVTADGRLIETEQELKESDLPAAVAKTLKEVLPSGEIEELEEKTVVIYSVEKKVGEKTYKLEIDANGNVLSIEAEYEGEDD